MHATILPKVYSQYTTYNLISFLLLQYEIEFAMQLDAFQSLCNLPARKILDSQIVEEIFKERQVLYYPYIPLLGQSCLPIILDIPRSTVQYRYIISVLVV